MSLLVGLDIGTSCVKAGLFEPGGRCLAVASQPVDVLLPQPGWAEQDPNAWWRAARRALQRVTQAVDGNEIDAVGLAGQCPGHVLVDRSGRAIGPAIIWRDQRSQAEARWLNEHIGAELAQRCLGSGAPFDASSPLSRLIWLRDHRPQDWEAARWVLQPKDYIALRLTGEGATDVYSAYCLTNPDSGQYEADLFAAAGLAPAVLPVALPPTAVVGVVSRAAGRVTGLPVGARVVCGTIDAYCDTLAGGIACPGRAVDVAGTSEIVSLRLDRPVQAEGVYPGELGEGVTFLCGPTQAGGETLRWLANGFYSTGRRARVHFAELEEEAGSVPAGAEGLVFLPYLNGERTPIWDADARGCFYGLTFAHQRRHCARAVYEGVGFAIRHILELCEAAHGQAAEKIVICGGGSRSAFWNQVKADILQRPVYPAEIAETGCLGAAILASVGVEVYPDLHTSSEDMVHLQVGVNPDHDQSAAYNRGYRIYRRLYPALKPLSIPGAEIH